MKKTICLVAVCALCSSCATVFSPTTTQHQQRKPSVDEPKREIRPGFLVADILLFPIGLVIDFATGAIYKPKGEKLQ